MNPTPASPDLFKKWILDSSGSLYRIDSNHVFSIILSIVFALLAAAAVIFIAFWILKKRSTLVNTLKAEMNLLLEQAEELRLYLSQAGHAWFKAGNVLTETPVHLRLETRVLNHGLPRFHLLTQREAAKVLLFYAAYEAVQRLVEILFARLRMQEEAGRPLTEKQVSMNKVRVRRIVLSLEVLVRARLPQRGLKRFPDSFPLPPARDFTAETDGILKQG